jgi:hypothetical protein
VYGQRFPENLGGLVVKTDQGYSVYRGTYQSDGTVVELGRFCRRLVSGSVAVAGGGGAGERDCVVSYLTDPIGWKADRRCRGG